MRFAAKILHFYDIKKYFVKNFEKSLEIGSPVCICIFIKRKKNIYKYFFSYKYTNGNFLRKKIGKTSGYFSRKTYFKNTAFCNVYITILKNTALMLHFLGCFLAYIKYLQYLCSIKFKTKQLW